MATTDHSFTFPSLTKPCLPLHQRCGFSVSTPSKMVTMKSRPMGGELLGDFGARDPFPAEIESNFAEKVLGSVDTEHRILIPKVSALSLAQQECTPVSPLAHLKKVIGWRLLDEEDGLKLQCLWKLRDFKRGVELVNRIYKVVEASGHFPNLHLEQTDQVRAELWTESIGLSMNDFIVAAKIDEIKTSDLFHGHSGNFFLLTERTQEPSYLILAAGADNRGH